MIRENEYFRPPAFDFADLQSLVVGILVLLLVVYALHLAFREGGLSRSRRWTSRRGSTRAGKAAVVDLDLARSSAHERALPNDMSDPRNQLDAISKVRFEKTRMLNSQEARLLPILDDLARTADGGYRVMAQTSLGELIRPLSNNKRNWARANASVNSKRLDFAIVNRGGLLVAAIEYQGSGHYHHDSFMRDAVKREALRKAGVPLIEIPKDFTPESVKILIEPLLTGR